MSGTLIPISSTHEVTATGAVFFPPGYRASGVLLHVTSLPSPYGIGDMGPAAFAWIDRLHEAGQSWWQALPLGPTGFGDSPYQALSSFASNGLLISPELLLEDDLLDENACKGQWFSSNAVDYAAVIEFKHRLLDRIWRLSLPSPFVFCQQRITH